MDGAVMTELRNSAQKRFYNVRELADILGVSCGLIYDNIYRHKIPCKRIGRRILIPYDYVERVFLH